MNIFFQSVISEKRKRNLFSLCSGAQTVSWLDSFFMTDSGGDAVGGGHRGTRSLGGKTLEHALKISFFHIKELLSYIMHVPVSGIGEIMLIAT